MNNAAERLLSVSNVEEESEANAFDDELLEALSEGEARPAPHEVLVSASLRNARSVMYTSNGDL